MDWLIFGIVIGLGAWGFYTWARGRKWNIAWYVWTLGVLAVIALLFAYQNYTASVAELEPEAAGFLLAAFGVPAVLLATIAVFLVWRNNKPTSAPAKS
jgi:hypothetical protein